MQKPWNKVIAIAAGTLTSCIVVAMLARFFDVVTIEFAIVLTGMLSATIAANVSERA